MELNLIVETKNFEDDKEFFEEIKANPCKHCIFGQDLMCVERKYCRWDSHKEIFIKKAIENYKTDYIITLESLVCFFAECYMKTKKTYRYDLIEKGKKMTDSERDLIISYQ